MTEDDALDALDSKQLHDLAVSHAKRHLNAKFFWDLFKYLPAAEAAAGEMDEMSADVTSLSGRLDDITDSGRKPIADELRPFYLEYLRNHNVTP